MLAKFKLLFTILMLFFVCFHFLLVIAFVNPIHKVEGKANFYAMYYLYPFFDQGWNLFAPVPTNNYHLFVKYKNGNQIEQIDLVQSILNNHLKNRLGVNELLVLALHNSIHSFEMSTPLQNKLNGPIKNDVTYSVVKHLVNQYLASTTNNHAKNIQTILLVENVITHQQRVYFD